MKRKLHEAKMTEGGILETQKAGSCLVVSTSPHA